MLEQVASAAVQVLVPHMNRLLPLVLLVLSCGACKKSSETKSVPASSPIQDRRIQQTYSNEPKIAACTLITTDEVGAIQGATITDAKSSEGPSGSLIMSQCYYSSKEPNMAVSLAVLQPNLRSSTGTEARDYWEKTMRGSSEQSTGEAQREDRDEKSEKGEEEEKKNPPKKVDGVGDEAYWSGNRFGGALYVLKRNVILRISIGGPDDQETKIEKSKSLAEKALGRLP
jgi:hypothetical protein